MGKPLRSAAPIRCRAARTTLAWGNAVHFPADAGFRYPCDMGNKLRMRVSACFSVLALFFLVLWPITLRSPLSATHPGSTPTETREFGIGDGRIWHDRTVESRYQSRSGPNPVWRTSTETFSIHLPLWFCAAAAITLAVVPRLPHPKYRFSLRDLLIITALIAALLGVVRWVSR